MSNENIGKKVQDAEQIGTEKVGDKESKISITQNKPIVEYTNTENSKDNKVLLPGMYKKVGGLFGLGATSLPGSGGKHLFDPDNLDIGKVYTDVYARSEFTPLLSKPGICEHNLNF